MYSPEYDLMNSPLYGVHLRHREGQGVSQKEGETLAQIFKWESI